ncbi:ester hydrolase C11orf54 homolog isoform X2 [Cataglyphis hispanica]|uniref:ester hydrolase C11orf54 homolog isoform X2 n=1 Tax=Cataglyphis hispanica TaxID=1086592 RepID=UPI00217FF259|nr:ester hydrolase C11orf54 homolog isoform X2 [Cataglyphis hispanica]
MGRNIPLVVRENNLLRYEDNIIANAEANINLEDEDDMANDDVFREDIYFGFEGDIALTDYAFKGNIYIEERKETIANGDANYNFQDENNILNSNEKEKDFRRNNGNEDDRSSYMLFTPTLEYIKNVLYDALHQLFDEFEIEIVSCPCLTKPPYNFAADGLSGNTGILQMGDIDNFCPFPRKNLIFDIQHILSKYYDDIFVIGSGFAAKPFMPYNGHLIINAIVSANPINVINNSCIITHEDGGLRRSEIIDDPNQMKCSIMGNFFFSEGKRGMVIKMRLKGNKTAYDIILLIQKCLNVRCRYPIGLGVVIVINGGQTIQFITPENYTDYWYDTYMDFYRWLKNYKQDCINLIAVGALTNSSFNIFGQNTEGNRLLGSRYRFNTFSNYEGAGEFCTDVASNETEYTVYLNIAQEIYF